MKSLKFLYLVSFFILSLFSSALLADKDQPISQLLAENLPARTGSQLITADSVVKIPIKYDPATIQWLDANRLVYGVPQITDSTTSEIGILNLSSKASQTIGPGIMPKASPNGLYIAYVKETHSQKQLYLFDITVAKERQLVPIKGGLTGGAGYNYDYAWSPNSKKIVLAYQPMTDFLGPSNLKINNAKTSAVTQETVEAKPPETSLILINLAKHKNEILTKIDAKIRYLSWFPDSKKVLFLKQREALSYHQTEDETLISSLDIYTHQIHAEAKIPGLQQLLFPVLSPSGKKVAYLYDGNNPLFGATTNLWTLVLSSKNKNGHPAMKPLTSELKLFNPAWLPDGSKIYALRYYGPYHQIYSIGIKDLKTQQITHGSESIDSFSFSPEGKKMAWVGLDAHGNYLIRTANVDGNNTQDLKIFPLAPNNTALSEVREMEWKTADYPYPIRGLLVLPLNYQPGKKYPLVTDIHGGGLGAYLDLSGGFWVSSPLEWQLWAAKGYMVFVPDMRSSGSYGSLAITKNEYQEHDTINKDSLDVIAGIDSLINKKMVDPKKIAVIGHSAGGRRVNWLAVTSHQFAALVSKEGWADEWLLTGINPIKRIIDAYGGTPVEVPQNYQKNSALFHAKGASTPILFLMSSPEKGADKYGGILWLYNAIKAQGVNTQYVQYPDEGHVLERPANRKDALERVIEWVDVHLLVKRN